MTTVDLSQMTGGVPPRPTYLSPGGAVVQPLWTGDIRVVGDNDYWIDKGQVAVQQTLPVSLQVVAVMPEMVTGDLPEEAYRPTQGQGQSGPRPPGKWMLQEGEMQSLARGRF